MKRIALITIITLSSLISFSFAAKNCCTKMKDCSKCTIICSKSVCSEACIKACLASDECKKACKIIES